MRIFFIGICLLVCVPLECLAQKTTIDRPDSFIELDPYRKTYFKDYYDYSNIQEITVIDKQKSNNFEADTLKKTYFNEKGMVVKKNYYENNVVASTTIFEYYPNDKLRSWELFDKRYSTIVLYYYNQQGQIAKTRKLKITRFDGKTDSTELITTKYKYGTSGLIEIESSVYGIEEYEYDSERLTSKISKHISRKFDYFDDANYVIVQDYYGNTFDSTKLRGCSKLYYDESDMLVMDSTELSTSKGIYKVANYVYDELGNLKMMHVEYDTLFSNVKFEFADSRLKKITVNTNGYSPYLRVHLNYRIQDYYQFPITNMIVFEYDRFGNKTSRKSFVNDELFTETEFLIKYRLY